MICRRSSPSCSVAKASLPVPRTNITRPATETTSADSSPSASAAQAGSALTAARVWLRGTTTG